MKRVTSLSPDRQDMQYPQTSIQIGQTLLHLQLTPPDGNCLFHSISFLAFLFEPTSCNFERVGEMYRQQSVEYLRGKINDPVYQPLLETASRDCVPMLPPNLAVPCFLNLLAQTRIYGGYECLFAMADLLHLQITVYLENGVTQAVEPTHGQYQRSVHIYYQNSHYSSIIGLDRIPNPCLTEGFRADPTEEIESVARNNPPVNAISLTPSHDPISAGNSSPDATPASAPKAPIQLRLGTWNVSGCSSSEKRRLLDQCLEGCSLDIVCLQESKLTSHSVSTTNYLWYNNTRNKDARMRGTSILVRKSTQQRVVGFDSYGPNLCVLHLLVDGLKLCVICYYSPSNGTATTQTEYVQLRRVLEKHQPDSEVYVLGNNRLQTLDCDPLSI